MGTGNRCDNKTAEPHPHHLITYKDSFLYPITKNGSTQNVRIILRWLFFPVPNPTNSPKPDDFSIKMLTFNGKDLGFDEKPERKLKAPFTGLSKYDIN